jgi:activator of HSP90 ATPase
MNEDLILRGVAKVRNRRRFLGGIAAAVGAVALGSRATIEAQETSMKEIPSTEANRKRTTLHYQVDFKASSQRVYDALLDAKQFAAFSGLPAEIDPKPGGTFSLFSAQIVGRNVELVPGQRIVQAWRPASWEPGVYSIVRFEIKPRGSESTMVLDHTGFAEGLADHLNSGWQEHYLDTMRKYFA